MVTMAIIAISIRSIEMVPPCWWIYLFFSCTNYGFQCARIDQCDIAFLWNWNCTFFFPWYSHKWHDQNHFFCCVLFKVKHHAIVLDCSHEYVTYFLLLSDIILESFISFVFWLIFLLIWKHHLWCLSVFRLNFWILMKPPSIYWNQSHWTPNAKRFRAHFSKANQLLVAKKCSLENS